MNNFEIIDPLTYSELLKVKNIKRLKRTPLTGVYFLVKKSKVVYVGQSLDIPMRVNNHISNPEMVFDNVLYIEVEPEKLIETEFNYIVALNPKYNKTCKYEIALNKFRIEQKRDASLEGFTSY